MGSQGNLWEAKATYGKLRQSVGSQSNPRERDGLTNRTSLKGKPREPMGSQGNLWEDKATYGKLRQPVGSQSNPWEAKATQGSHSAVTLEPAGCEKELLSKNHQLVHSSARCQLEVGKAVLESASASGHP